MRTNAIEMRATAAERTPDIAARTLVEHLYEHRFPVVPGVDIGTAYLLSEDDVRVGGDLIDVYQFNNGSVAISIADICGKGPEAAARAALVKFGLRAYVSAGFTPAQVLRNLNVLYLETSAYDDIDDDSFVTVFLGIVDPERRVMTYASGGHEAVMFLAPGRAPELLPPTAPIIGVFAESQKLFHQRLVCLPQGGSTLIATTDGVTEARTAAGAFLTVDGLMHWIESNRARAAQQQADELMSLTREFCGGRPKDDIAIAVARFSEYACSRT